MSQLSFAGGNLSAHSFNDALAGALRERRHSWRDGEAVTSELSRVLLEGTALRPDILVQPRSGNPIVIEVEIDSDPEPDARAQVGKRTTLGSEVLSVIGLKAPALVRGWSTPEVASAFLQQSRRGNDPGFALEYAVFQQGDASKIERWPERNYLSGSVDDLADLCETAATPHHVIETYANDVAKNIIAFADGLGDELPVDVAEEIATKVGQSNVAQGLRLACCIWMSTLRLHDLLATSKVPELSGLKSISEMRTESLGGETLTMSSVREAWRTILGYNYRSIFGPALDALVPAIPLGAGADTLTNLAELAEKVTVEGLGDHVDFAGELFPKLLEDRKETAANYTLPTTAAMLAKIAVDRMNVNDWSDDDEVFNLKIADFACGTGTLLRAAYKRIRTNYEAAGGKNVAALHLRMMEGGITGTDINPLAAHMTAAGLSTVEIQQSYQNTSIAALPVKGGKTGALEFLVAEQASDIFGETVEQSAREGVGSGVAAPNDAYSLVIQNPPYTRARGGRKMFDITGISEAHRAESTKRLSGIRSRMRKRGNSIVDGQAGMGADFSALADLKLESNGVFATVLPLSAAHAETWAGFRSHCLRTYNSLTAIAFVTDGSSMMSADTDIAEMLVIGDEGDENRHIGNNMLFCVNLSQRPGTIAEAQAIVTEVQRVRDTQEDSGLIRIAGVEVGGWIRQVVPSNDYPWFAVGTASRHLALASSKLLGNVLDDPQRMASYQSSLGMSELGKLCGIGPTHDQIGHPVDGDGRGAFAFTEISQGSVAVHPSLWSANATTQATILTEPTHSGERVRGRESIQRNMLNRMSNGFVSRNLRMTSQALVAAYTSDICMGGRAWTSLIHPDQSVKQACVMWFNSTLGMLVRLGYAQTTQPGRTTLGVGAMSGLPIPNFAEDSDAGEWARLVADEQFDRLARLQLQPAAYAWRDQNRHEIDHVVLEMLGIDSPDARRAVKLLRDLWCREPSVHGGNRQIMKDLGIDA